MVNVNAQEYINKKYPVDGTCQRENDQENKGKTRKGITLLDIRKGRVGSGIFNSQKNLVEDLKLEGFTNLQTLIISSHQLTNLDVGECKHLMELDCQKNKLISLNISGCSNLKKIDCSNNPLEELDLSNCDKLEEVNINNCPNLNVETIKSNLTYDSETGKLVKVSAEDDSKVGGASDNDIRNILIVGMTGGGKSTLANVLTNDTSFEEKDSSTSVTENFKRSKAFEWQQGEKWYCIVDNIGFGDSSNLSERDILFKVGEGVRSAREGINQILFVIDGRFTPDKVEAFNKFKNFLYEKKITEFITIIRTHFKDFRSKEKCEEDLEKLKNESRELRGIINSCRDFIYVDNPPMPIIDEKDGEEEKEDKEKRMKINGKKRELSRERILNYLTENCSEVYKLKNWDDISSQVDEYIKRKAEIEKSPISQEEKEKKIEKERELVAEEVKFRLEFDPTVLKAAVEVEAKGLSCSLL